MEEGEKIGPDIEEIKNTLRKFKNKEKWLYREIKGKALKFLIQENVLFYNPVEGTVCPQGRLILKAIRELCKDLLK